MSNGVILTALGTIVTSILIGSGFWLATRALFPRFTQHSSDRWSRPILNLFIGLIAGIPIIWMGQELQHGHGGLAVVKTLAGIVLTAIPVVFGLTGLAGLASRIGRGLKIAGEEPHSWKATLRGGIVIGLVAGLPLGGDGYLCLALLVAAGLGNYLRSARSKSDSKDFASKNREGRERSARKPLATGNVKNDERRSRPPRRNRPPRSRDADKRSDRTEEKKG